MSKSLIHFSCKRKTFFFRFAMSSAAKKSAPKGSAASPRIVTLSLEIQGHEVVAPKAAPAAAATEVKATDAKAPATDAKSSSSKPEEPPKVVDVIGGGADGAGDEDLCEDDEVFAEDHGTGADDEFARIIGTIEDFMVSDAIDEHRDAYFKALPPFKSVDNEHEQHSLFKKYVAEVDGLLDVRMAEAVPEKKADEIAALIEARHDELSEEVWEFVSGACLDFQQFVALWKEAKAQNK